MAFEKKIPEWKAAGSEPPESLKTSGFTVGYKPPADYFNWFWYNVSECLKELQAEAIHENVIDTTVDVNLDDFNTVDYIGLWCCGGTNLVKNKPSGVDSFGLLVVRTATGYFTQVLTAGNRETDKTYVRTYGAGSWSVWKEFAFTEGNVASATKLETARKINGIPFDGTEDISVGCIGYEPITAVENDTVASWRALGSGYAVYTTEKLNGQPTDYGFVVQYVYNSLLYQEFHSMPTGGTWYRKGNNIGWWNDAANKGEWRKVYDELNKPEQLAVARNINGVPFDGSKNIEINPIATLLEPDSDLNNYGSIGNVGFWYAVGGNAIKNKPNGIDAFGLLVMRSASGYFTQILVGGSSNTNILYSRTYSGSSWTAWTSVYSSGNKPTPADIGAAPSVAEKLTLKHASETPASNDLLNVNLNGDYESASMQHSHVATEDMSSYVNKPPVLKTGAFYAYRTVEYFPVGHVCVRLYETYPCNGRIWSNMYDKNMQGWMGWMCNGSVVAEVGKETITNEVFDGRPVYTKLVNCGVCPSQSIKMVAHEASVRQMLRVNASLSNYGITAPYFNVDNYSSDKNYLDVTASATYVIVKCSATAWAQNGYSLAAQIWYTKL